MCVCVCVCVRMCICVRVCEYLCMYLCVCDFRQCLFALPYHLSFQCSSNVGWLRCPVSTLVC